MQHLAVGRETRAGREVADRHHKVATELSANKGAALVVSGSNSASVQTIVNAINELIGANGTTINWAITNNMRQGIDSEFAQLVADMDAGRVGGLILYGANPAYDYYDAERFKKALQKLKLSVSLSERMDETTELCKYVVPSHHYLESWGDAEPKKDTTIYYSPPSLHFSRPALSQNHY
jgi:molybdopterin-containing oxidoreductase family iron-sulfur binding subunit